MTNSVIPKHFNLSRVQAANNQFWYRIKSMHILQVNPWCLLHFGGMFINATLFRYNFYPTIDKEK